MVQCLAQAVLAGLGSCHIVHQGVGHYAQRDGGALQPALSSVMCGAFSNS